MKEKSLGMINRIMLGLVMLVPGLLKLFVSGASGVSGMISGIALFSWAPMFWAWVLILSEILFGIAILAKYELKYTVIPPMIILLVAGLTVAWGSWPSVLMHLTIIANLAVLADWKF